MIDDYEVQVRRLCPAVDCSGGMVFEKPKRKCEVCEGVGYLYEWKDLVTLIRQMINVG